MPITQPPPAAAVAAAKQRASVLQVAHNSKELHRLLQRLLTMAKDHSHLRITVAPLGVGGFGGQQQAAADRKQVHIHRKPALQLGQHDAQQHMG
jgi:hypothetical protein